MVKQKHRLNRWLNTIVIGTNLSDQKLSELLKSIGLPIARRTVTKYRHEVEVDSSYNRKQELKVGSLKIARSMGWVTLMFSFSPSVILPKMPCCSISPASSVIILKS